MADLKRKRETENKQNKKEKKDEKKDEQQDAETRRSTKFGISIPPVSIFGYNLIEGGGELGAYYEEVNVNPDIKDECVWNDFENEDEHCHMKHCEFKKKKGYTYCPKHLAKCLDLKVKTLIRYDDEERIFRSLCEGNLIATEFPTYNWRVKANEDRLLCQKLVAEAYVRKELPNYFVENWTSTVFHYPPEDESSSSGSSSGDSSEGDECNGKVRVTYDE